MTLTLTHPQTPSIPVAEAIHGVDVVDPYRWLEDQDSAETRAWIEAQRDHTRAYFESVPMREFIRHRVGQLLSVSSVEPPWSVGDHYYFLKRQKGREQPVIMMRNGLFGEERILVDPSLRSTGNTTAVAIVAISEDEHFLAYSVRQRGTDHASIEILDLKSNRILPDGLPEGFCSGFVFSHEGSGFYYSHRQVQDPRPNYKAVFRHRYGTANSKDLEIFFAGDSANLFVGILNSSNTDCMVYIAWSAGKDRRASLYAHDLRTGTVNTLFRDLSVDSFSPFFVGDRLFAYTDFRSPNSRIVHIDLNNPDPAQWRDIVPESERRIQQFAVAGDRIFVTRIDRFTTNVEAFDLCGNEQNGLPIAAHGTVYLVNNKRRSDKLFFSYTSISKPPITYCYDTKQDQICIWDRPDVSLNLSLIAVEEVSYSSKDGMAVPMILAYRRDLRHNGPLPTFLTGYGGFASCVTPRFTAFATFLIEQGFLVAVPALRGGSELGAAWHFAGRRDNRQHSFDDFIAAAEWLVSKGHSAPGSVAIGGGSNAGLLVGVAITQRPDLFRAAICLGPLLDMLRYHLFDFAAGWADEYGSPEDEEDFRSLVAYSPYHNVRDAVDYPAVLLISGDADTRCNPMHARKMTARLQAATTSSFPVLLDYKPAWGHTPVQPLSTKIEALTDRLTFVCNELRVHVHPWRSL